MVTMGNRAGRSVPLSRRAVRAMVAVLSASAATGACVAPSPEPTEEHVGQVAEAVINGNADVKGAYGAVGSLIGGKNVLSYPGNGCSGTLIADRVVLSAAHCVANYLTHCAQFADPAQPNYLTLQVLFANTPATPLAANQAGFDSIETAKARAVSVVGIATVDGVADVIPAACCASYYGARGYAVHGAFEPVLLFLAERAPSDVTATPLPLIVHPSAIPAKPVASATLATFPGLLEWGAKQPARLVTFAGYGGGSHSYCVDPTFDGCNGRIRGRDFGVTTWTSTSGRYDRAGLTSDCNAISDLQFHVGVETGPTDICDATVKALDPNGYGGFDLAIPGALQSATGDADSGGPVLVGRRPSISSNGLQPTPLDPPVAAQGDSYQLDQQYIVGVASSRRFEPDAACGDDGKRPRVVYSPTFTTTVAQLFAKNLNDEDSDGVVDPLDECPGQDDSDWDGDGILNCKDVCPCDIPDLDFFSKGVELYDNDQDHDGHCKDECPHSSKKNDNCPYVENEAQSNINRVSESAHLADVRGTECDAAVTPLTVAQPVAVGSKQDGLLTCTTYDRGTFGLRGMASRHAMTGFGYYPPAPAQTGGRVCVPSIANNITCTKQDQDIRDAVFDQKPFGAPSEADEGDKTHWHRPTIQAPCKASPCPALKPDATFALSYTSLDTNPDSPPFAKYRWLYKDVDYPKWFGKGWLTGTNGPQDLAVNVLFHSAEPWGGASGPRCPQGNFLGNCNVGAGLHLSKVDATGLNNFYYKGLASEDDFHPLFTECRALQAVKIPLFEVFPQPPVVELPHLVVQPSIGADAAPISGSFAVGPAGTQAAAILVPLPAGQIGALSAALGTNLADVVTPQVGPSLATALASGQRLWSTVEPSPALGAGPTFPIAVGLSATGDQLTSIARVTGTTISAQGDAPICVPPAAPSAPAVLRTLGSFGSAPGQLIDPVGVGTDAAGNVFVTDRGNQRICKFGPDGGFLFCWGTPGTGDGEFGGSGSDYGPYGLEVDKGFDRVCVADTINSRVQCFDTAGNFLFKFGSFGIGPGQFASEIGLGFDPLTHEIYVADTFQQRVQVFDGTGTFVRQFGTPGQGPGELGYPRDVVIDLRGNVYVAEHGNHRISKFDRQGNFVRSWGSFGSSPGQFYNPHAVALDAQSLVYVGDLNNSRVQVFSPDGGLVALWGGFGTAEGQFRGTIGVDLDVRGQIYVSDHFNNRVQVFAPLGNGCANCPSGQCLADQPGVCCEQACTLASDCASGYCGPQGRCDAPPRSGSPHATDFAAVLTRYRRGLFVVGGDDPETKKPTGEIWFTSLASNRWGRVATVGYAPERVLAATYSFASDRLYILDEKQGSARLTAVDPISGVASAIGAWPRHAEWDREYLVVDRDGALLVASSKSAGKKHAIFRIDARKKPPTIDGVEKGKRAFVYQPVVDMSGYTLVLRQDQGNDKIEVVGEHALNLTPATLADLGDQL